MKFLCLFVISFALFAVSSGEEGHNVEFGGREDGDSSIYRDIIQMDYSFWQIVKKDVSLAFNKTITFIQITDQYQDGNGGYASLLKGGPGEKDVTMHFKSQRNHGFNFIVEIFGKN